MANGVWKMSDVKALVSHDGDELGELRGLELIC